jgi:putative flippase GtrA
LIGELFRFSVVGAICTTIDLGLGLTTINLCNLPTYVAATIGWCGGGITGYLLHLRWTFSHRKTIGTWVVFRLYFANCVIILFTRWLIIALTGAITAHAELTLIIAVIGSFGVNYFISRNFVFR